MTKKRGPILICPKDSSFIYEDALPQDLYDNIEKYQPTYDKNNLLKTITFTNEHNKTLTVEWITKSAYRSRKAVMVCPKDSAVIYEGALPQDLQENIRQYQPTYDKNNLLKTITFTNEDNKTLTVEWVKESAYRDRKTVKVFPKGSAVIYEGALPQDLQQNIHQYQPTYDTNNLLETITFTNEHNKNLTVEWITKTAYSLRKPVMVSPKGSSFIYEGALPQDLQQNIDRYNPTYGKNGILKTITFTNDNNQELTVEWITKSTYSYRTPVNKDRIKVSLSRGTVPLKMTTKVNKRKLPPQAPKPAAKMQLNDSEITQILTGQLDTSTTQEINSGSGTQLGFFMTNNNVQSRPNTAPSVLSNAVIFNVLSGKNN